jgi:hypothetical protein
MSTKIYKLQYLSLCSAYFKYEDRSKILSINWIYGEKPILRFCVFPLRKSKWLFIFPEAWIEEGNLGENFETWVFIFSLNLSIFHPTLIEMQFWVFNLENSTLGLKQLFWVQVWKKPSHEKKNWFSKKFEVSNPYLANFSLNLSFHVYFWLIQFSWVSCFTHHIESPNMI